MVYQNDSDDAALDEAIGHTISFGGSPVTEHDRRVIKQLWKEYIKNKKASPTDVVECSNHINTD